MDYEVKARRYDIAVLRYFQGEFQSPNRRFLRLFDLEKIQGDDLGLSETSGVTIAFSDVAPEAFGTFNAAQGSVYVSAHISDFSDIYHMVQSESPIYFRWKESPEDPGKIARYTLHANHEAVGEGLADSSP